MNTDTIELEVRVRDADQRELMIATGGMRAILHDMSQGNDWDHRNLGKPAAQYMYKLDNLVMVSMTKKMSFEELRDMGLRYCREMIRAEDRMTGPLAELYLKLSAIEEDPEDGYAESVSYHPGMDLFGNDARLKPTVEAKFRPYPPRFWDNFWLSIIFATSTLALLALVLSRIG
jgi:hypothetical protein